MPSNRPCSCSRHWEALRFQAFSDAQEGIRSESIRPCPAETAVDEAGKVLQQWKTYKTWSFASFPHADPLLRTLLEVSKFLSSMNAANYMMSHKQKLLLIMLIDGEHWRAHNKQIFKYNMEVLVEWCRHCKLKPATSSSWSKVYSWH